MRLKTLLAGAAALTGIFLAQPALAATVGVFEDEDNLGFSPPIRYDAAAGELNALTAVEEPAGTYTITDLGAVITPVTPGCVSLTPTAVRCLIDPDPDNTDLRAWFFLGDGADTADVGSSYGAYVRGGAGADMLTGSADYQFLVGGPGADGLVGGQGGQVVSGGKGSDSLNGGPGDDALVGGAGTDVIAGGSGFDEVSYADHVAPVRISLDDRANDGAAGEDDWVQPGVEFVVGSRGPTTFIGNARANGFFGFGEGDVVRAGAGFDLIDAHGGPNVVLGGAGDDIIDGGGGRDLLWGGAGDDRISADGGADVIRGGRGNDVISGWGGADDIVGGRGDDRLGGGRGRDIVRGGDGHDRLYGNEGADFLYARDRNRDQVDGGAGSDRAQVDPIDRLFSVEELFE